MKILDLTAGSKNENHIRFLTLTARIHLFNTMLEFWKKNF